MGNKLALEECTPFDWQTQFQIIDTNIHDNFLNVRSLATGEQYIGKQYIATSSTETNLIEALINSKTNRKNSYINRLVWVHRIKDISYCSYQTKFYFAFQKYALNLKEEKIRRQFSGQSFSEAQVMEIVHAVVEGLLYLKGMGQPHQRVCLQNIFLRQDRSVMLSDPWLFSKEYTSIYTFHLNGFIYPSPEKILYQSDMIDNYDPYLSDYYSLGVLALELIHQEQMDIIYEKGFRRILEDTISKLIGKVQNKELKQKLKVLMSYDPQQRQLIQKLERGNSEFGLRCQGQARTNNANEVMGQLYATAHEKPKEKYFIKKQSDQKPQDNYVQTRMNVQQQIPSGYSSAVYFDAPQILRANSNIYYRTGDFTVFAQQQAPKPKIIFIHSSNPPNHLPQQSSQSHIPTNFMQNKPIQLQKSEVPVGSQRPGNGILLGTFSSIGSKQMPLRQWRREGEPLISNVSIEEEINRIISSLRSDKSKDAGLNNKQSLQNVGIRPFEVLQRNQRNIAQSEKKTDPQELQNSQKILSGLSASYNNMAVKNSFTEEENREESKPKGEGDQSFRSIKHLTSFGQVFKETQSINQSFDDRSDNMSVVIGHRFSSKDSSVFSNFKPDVSLEQRASVPEKVPKDLLTIQERSNSEADEALLQSKIEQDEVKTSQTHPEQIKAQQLFQTPQHRPCSKRYNSTIKQVSEQQPSIEQIQNDLQERVIQYQVGTKYIGQVKNGKRYGKGLFYYIDGSYYEGQWKDNKMHGKGCLYYSNGSIAYEGGWYMDTFHGKGRIYNDQPTNLNSQFDYRHMTNDYIDEYWYSYEGDFFFEQKHGKGKLKLSNGEAYIGQFSEDKVNGRGKFYKLNGDVIQGKWVSGELSEEFV